MDVQVNEVWQVKMVVYLEDSQLKVGVSPAPDGTEALGEAVATFVVPQGTATRLTTPPSERPKRRRTRRAAKEA